MRRPVIPLLAAVSAMVLAACGSGGADPARTSLAPTTAATSSAPPTTAASSPSATVSSAPTTSATPRASASRSRFTASPRTKPPHASGRGRVVVLNPGHNGGNGTHVARINRLVPAGYGDRKACDTTGTNTNAGYPEHAFTWDVSLRVRKILRAHGLTVVLTRPDDSGVGPCVDERAEIGNKPDVAAVVSIHADGAPASGHGFHVNQDSRRPDGATKAVAADSVRLGRAIHRTLVAGSGLTPSNYIGTDGYYYRSDLAGLNLATRPATFLELGNMRNAGDAATLSSTSGRARIAKSVAAGILAYLGVR